MITIDIIEARIRRKRIKQNSGDNFIDRDRVLAELPALATYGDQQFLFAIRKTDKIWVALSVRHLFYSYDGEVKRLDVRTESNLVHRFFSSEGNKFAHEVILPDHGRIWMHSDKVSSGIQNIMLLLEDLPDDMPVKER
jgi:hypothetical protein